MRETCFGCSPKRRPSSAFNQPARASRMSSRLRRTRASEFGHFAMLEALGFGTQPGCLGLEQDGVLPQAFGPLQQIRHF
jgi:hypothetical protein